MRWFQVVPSGSQWFREPVPGWFPVPPTGMGTVGTTYTPAALAGNWTGPRCPLDRIKVSAGQDQGVQPTSQRSTGANVATTQGTLAGSTLALGVSVRAGDRNRGNERNGVEDRDPWDEREAVQDRNRGAAGLGGHRSLGGWLS